MNYHLLALLQCYGFYCNYLSIFRLNVAVNSPESFREALAKSNDFSQRDPSFSSSAGIEDGEN